MTEKREKRKRGCLSGGDFEENEGNIMGEAERERRNSAITQTRRAC